MLTAEQRMLVATVDKRAKRLLAQGESDKKLLLAMYDLMPKIKAMITTVPEKVMDLYCVEYEGFHYTMKALEHLAQTFQNRH